MLSKRLWLAMYRVCAEVVVKYEILRKHAPLLTQKFVQELHVSQQPIIYSDP
jgi:hypothetical protein